MDLIRLRDVVKKLLFSIFGLGLLFAALNFFPAIAYFRGSDIAPLVDSLPDISESGFSSFEGAKLIPLENYHSGIRNEVFYLFGKKLFKAELHYYSSDTSRKIINVSFLLNHKFISPIFLDSAPILRNSEIFTFKLIPNAPLIIPFEIPISGFGVDDFYLSISSIQEPFYNPLDSIVYLNSSNQYHCNLVKRFYIMPDQPRAINPDTTKSLRPTKERELIVLKKNRSIAIVNRDTSPKSFVISQPNKTPIYVKVNPFESTTFRNILSTDSSSVIVTDMPYQRLETLFGRSKIRPYFSFIYSTNDFNGKTRE